MENNKGLQAVLQKAMESYDKLPMLEVVFERLTRLLSAAFRDLTSEPVEIKLEKISYCRFSAFITDISTPSSIAVFKVLEFENMGLLVIDGDFIFTLVGLLFGEKRLNTDASFTNQSRPYTYIEQAIIKQFIEVFLNELSAAFDPIASMTCVLERLETNPSFAAIARPADNVISLRLQVDISGKQGILQMVLPYATIAPIKNILQQVFLGEKLGHDPDWQDVLMRHVNDIELQLEAVIVNKPSSLKDIASAKVGQTLILDHGKDADVLVRCKNIKLFKGSIGKVDEKVAINITAILPK